jgi:hypothetical protein
MRRRFFAVCLIAALAASIPTAAQQPADSPENFDKHIELRQGGSLLVENDRGTVSVEGWDKPEIYVEVHKYYEGMGNREEWMRQTEVRIEGGGSQASIKVRRPNNFCIGFCNYRAGVDLKMHVPHKLELDIRSGRSDISVRSIEGRLHVDSDRSSIYVNGFSGGMHISGDRAKIEVRDAAITSGLRISSSRGPVDLTLKQLAGESRIETDRADIDVSLPGNAAFNLDVEKDRRSGFRSDFPLTMTGNFNSGNVRAAVNGGGPSLYLRADRATIHLRSHAMY